MLLICKVVHKNFFSMNKLLIVFLAVCLVSVHAFVKRDAPAATTENILGKLVDDFTKLAQNLNAKVKDAFNSETFDKELGGMVQQLNQAVSNLKVPAQPAGQ